MTDTTWAPDACTLPTIDRPLREREFSGLFRTSLRAASIPTPTRAELVLDADSEPAARELAGRETSCCSFFEFGFVPEGDTLTMMIEVPASRADVLAALVESARRDAGLTKQGDAA
ncbi:hypothetical protein [Agromyces lapidis]|uniref:Arsenate reductase n=1 Tax=Agromyces lapidis TaxID=279574 RepID=A0ABV5SUE6_9MICO|nr:hypothetical protein [Agromyces lapidis]